MLVNIIQDDAYISMVHYPEHGIVHHSFRQPVTGQMFRDRMNLGTEFLREHSADKWLSDDRLNAGGLTPEDNRWALEVWFPQTKAAGWKYWGLVVPGGDEARASMLKIVQYFTLQGVDTRLFADPEQAMEWLKSV
jgi:hypothetical protein